ncbi:coiled-coil domain-containing protein 27-like isoform X2 [Pelobates fuscus]|uniref:coiled-coil domain-containing protein 27-like isoform X2 n=1 Tax=Pelobates fuscus TaxID=191477 RepID=UPI002FE495A4
MTWVEPLLAPQIQDSQFISNGNRQYRGTVISLQRQISLQECQLRRSESEKDTLQRHLKERIIQIKAMSSKFSRLREEGNHEEMMAAIRKENCDIKELVLELKSELIKQNDKIDEFKTQVLGLQKETIECQSEINKLKQEKHSIQSKAEDLEYSELHVKMDLESLKTRFEKFRSQIIQITFSAPGATIPKVELTDDDILAAMQKVIVDFSEFNQQPKQKEKKIGSQTSQAESTKSQAKQ